jgi:hypothetical protein
VASVLASVFRAMTGTVRRVFRLWSPSTVLLLITQTVLTMALLLVSVTLVSIGVDQLALLIVHKFKILTVLILININVTVLEDFTGHLHLVPVLSTVQIFSTQQESTMLRILASASLAIIGQAYHAHLIVH